MRNNKKIIVLLLVFLAAAGIISASGVFLPKVCAAADAKAGADIDFYTCGMHPSVRVTPQEYAKGQTNCPICNMKLTPVYKQESKAPASHISIPAEQARLAGVKTEAVSRRRLFKEIRTVGQIAYDPELYKAEEELIQAIKAEKAVSGSEIKEVQARGSALKEAAILKLRLSGLSDEQIEELIKLGRPDRSLLISDRQNPFVWVYGDIYEHDSSWVRGGQPIRAVAVGFPGEEYSGTIAAIDPVLNPMTRSARIRVKVENPELKLKPQMYVDVFIQAYLAEEPEKQEALAVPADAVLDTGARRIVYVDSGNGSYAGREVRLGPEAMAYVDGRKQRFFPVTDGLLEGDRVVTRANFLIDSQSQLSGAAASVYGGALGGKEDEKKPTGPPHSH